MGRATECFQPPIGLNLHLRQEHVGLKSATFFTFGHKDATLFKQFNRGTTDLLISQRIAKSIQN